ncbi:MAG: hypothetical protein ACR2OL_09495 [Anderseniella sp.]
MNKTWISITAAIGFSCALTGTAGADEAAEKMVDDALQYMYHSCNSVVDEAENDNAYIDKVIRALTAVSLYNHEIDISKYAKTDDEKTALHDKFVEAIAKKCKSDKEALLAGVIDDAVVYALSLK